MKIDGLRKKYPKFIYQKYFYCVSKGNLEIFFDFKIEPDICFKPKIIIKNIDKKQLNKIGKNALNNLIFHLGLMEIPSYWKATCSPEIEIRAGFLNKEQIKWWKDLIMKGMGQFFYENRIDFTRPNFLKIYSTNRDVIPTEVYQDGFPVKKGNKILVPVGGGKDSAVTLELLKKTRKNISCFSLNPTIAASQIMKIASREKPIIVKRRIDPKLLELNRRGFLNGHTPFSAHLAFLSVLCAVIFNTKYIAFSNERSSNEGNLKYLGKIINHQWSKSFDFEKKFRNYSKRYLAKNIEYFSFLRPLYEIQIAKLFAKYPKYSPAFLSCNEAYKTASGTKKPTKKWCGKCSKCLFVFVVLYPFVDEKKLIKIFKKNLFEDKNLIPVMKELIGEQKFKPFECVGTQKESLIAFYLSREKIKKGKKIPFLLNYFKKEIMPEYPNLKRESKKMINLWNNQHNLPKELEKILKNLL